MKLRCTTNSIRVRIRKSELNTLAEEGSIKEQVGFGHQVSFSFVLFIDHEAQEVHALLNQNTITIHLPTSLAQTWINSQQVSIQASQVLENEQYLDILVEKDFPCTDRENEDKNDTFWELAQDQNKPETC